jgi:hypothetical protein
MWIEKSCRVGLRCRVVKGFLYSRAENHNEDRSRVLETQHYPTSLHESGAVPGTHRNRTDGFRGIALACHIVNRPAAESFQSMAS